VPFLSGLFGFGVSTLMARQKDIQPAANLEEFALGG